MELGSKSNQISPELKDKLNGNRISFKLSQNESQTVFQTTRKEIKAGLPIEKLIILRNNESKIFNKGNEIMSHIDTDVLGEVACCPYRICI